MFLRNYDNFMAAYAVADHYGSNGTSYRRLANSTYTATSTSLFEDGQLNQHTTNGGLTNIQFTGGSYYLFSPAQFTEYSICLGNGNTAVTYDDYKLSGDVITNKLVRVSRTLTYDAENHKWKITLICTYTNSGDTNITISEWGIYSANQHNYYTYSNNSSYYILMFREVLDEPIVIEPSTSATIEFSIDVPMANHP